METAQGFESVNASPAPSTNIETTADTRLAERATVAEQAYLGALLNGAAIDPSVTVESFARPDHALIFGAIMRLAKAEMPYDVASTYDALAAAGDIWHTGNLPYLRKLADETLVVGDVAAQYAATVCEIARLRRLELLGSDIERAISNGATSLQIAESLGPVLDSFTATVASQPKRCPLEWAALQDLTPPDRDWVVPHWLGMGHSTLIAGAGGMGKTGLAQALASCVVLQREYLDWIPKPRTVLMWACEDDEAELWRRQVAIARWLDVPLSDFTNRLHLYSFDGADVELAGLIDQRRLIEGPVMATLREQIGDHKAELVILDNIARVYGGNENDRHQVHTFIAMLNAAAKPTGAAMALLAHPSKAMGSEYSGSTAWEGAVRGRLYLSKTLPDQEASEETNDDTVRYLSRRKHNYSPKDWRRIHYRDGVMVPEVAEAEGPRQHKVGPEYARDVVTRAVRKLGELGEYGTTSLSSPNYLPKLAQRHQLLDHLTEKEFGRTVFAMLGDGALTKVVVGFYSNRTKKEGLILPGMSIPPL
jgi:RecA-family ATPase